MGNKEKMHAVEFVDVCYLLCCSASLCHHAAACSVQRLIKLVGPSYHKKFQDWLDSWYTGEVQAAGQQDQGEAEEDEGGEEEGWNDVPGLWYDGGSFFPHEDGFNTGHHPSVRRPGDNRSAQFKQE